MCAQRVCSARLRAPASAGLLEFSAHSLADAGDCHGTCGAVHTGRATCGTGRSSDTRRSRRDARTAAATAAGAGAGAGAAAAAVEPGTAATATIVVSVSASSSGAHIARVSGYAVGTAATSEPRCTATPSSRQR